METLGSVCTFFAALFAVIGKGQWDTHPGLLGLAITYATTVGDILYLSRNQGNIPRRDGVFRPDACFGFSDDLLLQLACENQQRHRG